MARVVSVVLDIVGIIMIPVFLMGVLMLCHVSEDVAGWLAFVLMLVLAGWHFIRLIKAIAARLLTALAILALCCLVSAQLANAAPARATDTSGGCTSATVVSDLMGGWLAPGVFPPWGHSYVECAHTGHYPMIGMTTNYGFHARLAWKWASIAYSSTNDGYIYNVENQHVTDHTVQVWYDPVSDRATIDKGNTQVIVKSPKCPGCLTIRVVGQVHVDAIPFVGIVARTTHPWVEFTIGADGQFVGGDWSHAIF
jgi:hypothetical protein